jgi:formate dehydrogenase subunit gamma
LGVAGGRAYKIGAFEAMGEGTVDVNWAKKHHRPWVEEQLARAANETRGQPTATLME